MAIFAILGLTAAPALAASPHFVTASGATDDDGNFPSDPKKHEAAGTESISGTFDAIVDPDFFS